MTEYEERIEARARAIYEAEMPDADWSLLEEWPEMKGERDRCLRLARATMEADDAAGYVLVPRKTTLVMNQALEKHMVESPSKRRQYGAHCWDAIVAWRVLIDAGAIRKE
jgi:hypothetical protein